MRILYGTDFLLMPFFILIIYFIFKSIKNRYYKNTIIAQYFVPALMIRLFGAFMSALMYQYYYKYGDTFYYFTGVMDIFHTFLSDPVVALEMCFNKHENLSPEALRNITYHRLFRDSSSGLVMQLGGLFSPLVLGSYLGVSFIFTIFAFLGSWLMYRVFVDMYPRLHKSLAFAILFVPSIWFWGVGLMKDSLTMGGLGFLFWGCYTLFIKRASPIKAISAIFIGAYMVAFVKVYVILALAPALIVWIFLMYKNQIPIPWLRTIATPLFLGVAALGGVIMLQKIGQYFSHYALENILNQAAKTQWWIALNTEKDGGTGYTLGELDPSIGGMIKMFPKAVNVTLFRPYIWESRKIIVIPSILESGITLFLTLRVIWTLGFFKTIKSIFADPVVLFCLIFALIFAFAVGFSTMNFGALARYKIPCLPFYFAALIILYHKKPKPNSLPPKKKKKRSLEPMPSI